MYTNPLRNGKTNQETATAEIITWGLVFSFSKEIFILFSNRKPVIYRMVPEIKKVKAYINSNMFETNIPIKMDTKKAKK